MGKGYDKNKEHSYISYLDANNLYGWAMCQPLPDGEFAWNLADAENGIKNMQGMRICRFSFIIMHYNY